MNVSSQTRADRDARATGTVRNAGRFHVAIILVGGATSLLTAPSAQAADRMQTSSDATGVWRRVLFAGTTSEPARQSAFVKPVDFQINAGGDRFAERASSNGACWALQLGIAPPPHVFRARFGPERGLPLAGDFNGDGHDEVAVYCDGLWYIDLNGNSVTDAADAWIDFGTAADQPLVGDWNGDGKSDLGLYRAYDAQRSANTGTEVIVVPVIGDWQGRGRPSIGVFCDGMWMLDMDADGRLTEADLCVRLGAAGDRPIVGDFNRDGIDELGVYRNGFWHIDTSGDQQLGDDDLMFQLGSADELPVVGDWDGDGRDQFGVVKITPGT